MSENTEKQVRSHASRSDEQVNDEGGYSAARYVSHKDSKTDGPPYVQSLTEVREVDDPVRQYMGDEFDQPAILSNPTGSQLSQAELAAHQEVREMTNRIQKYWDAYERHGLDSTLHSGLGKEDQKEMQKAIEHHRSKLRSLASHHQTGSRHQITGHYYTPTAHKVQKANEESGLQPGSHVSSSQHILNVELPRNSTNTRIEGTLRNRARRGT